MQRGAPQCRLCDCGGVGGTETKGDARRRRCCWSAVFARAFLRPAATAADATREGFVCLREKRKSVGARRRIGAEKRNAALTAAAAADDACLKMRPSRRCQSGADTAILPLQSGRSSAAARRETQFADRLVCSARLNLTRVSSNATAPRNGANRRNFLATACVSRLCAAASGVTCAVQQHKAQVSRRPALLELIRATREHATRAHTSVANNAAPNRGNLAAQTRRSID